MDKLNKTFIGINWYTSLAELYNEAKDLPFDRGGEPGGFFGHPDPKEAVEYCRHGLNEKDTSEARKLFLKIDTAFRDRTRQEWLPSVGGAYACVPEYLQGQPEHMRTMHDTVSDKAPITYWIEAVVSQGVGVGALKMRAAAIAALIMRTSEERPVELNVFTGGKPADGQDYLFVAPIDSHPVSLVETLGALGTREYCRTINFTLLAKYSIPSRSIGWACGYPGEKREKKLREIFHADPQDVVIQGGYLPDEALMQSDPVAWVHKQLDKQREVQL